VVPLLTGARTEELRALTWAHVDLEGSPANQPAVPPSISLWRSVRRGGDTKTAKSRRTLELPQVCVDALNAHRPAQLAARSAAGERWRDTDLVFTTQLGTALDAANVRRAFRKVVAAAGLDASAWTPRELRHSFVSLLSSTGMPIEDFSHLVGHANTRVTELVYRKELRPMLTRGASAMDSLFGEAGGRRKVSS
jgi:integrase